MTGYRFLILDAYYHSFLVEFYGGRPDLLDSSYQEAWTQLMSRCFGTADFYSKSLEKLGHDAREVIVNDSVLQSLWAREHGLEIGHLSPMLLRQQHIGRILKKIDRSFNLGFLYRVLRAQVETFKPDILYVQDIGLFHPRFLRSLKSKVRLILGQIASPIPPLSYLKPYDLILSSFPHFVEKFRKMGLCSEYFKLAFEKSLLPKLKKSPHSYEVAFVGGISPHHRQRLALLDALIQKDIHVDLWGYRTSPLIGSHALFERHHGPAWGLDMYNVLHNSKISINHHLDLAGPYANNMRLYESTGVGTMLLTDMKSNLHDLFEPGKEVETYQSPEELVQKIGYYLQHESERLQIAHAGQARTLRDHNYEQRTQELEGFVKPLL